MQTGKLIYNRWQKHFAALGACIVLAIFYFTQSDPSVTGFYQQDEVGHFLQIMQFWKDPLTILTDMWARGGYKILYALPGLAGWAGIVATNIFFAVGSGYIAYLLARKYQMRNAWIVIAFTGLQPLMITMGFRCYPELPATFFTILLLYAYQNKRYISAALIASFLFTIRQEMAILALILGVIFIFKKQWLPLLCLSAAPLVLDILGYIKHHDLLYVVHLMVEGGLKEDYRRNGFFYLWVMLPDLTGIVVFYFLTVSAVAFIAYKHRKQVLIKYHMAILVFLVYFLMHCVFTSKAFGFGRSGGATRFLMPVLPIISLLALGGLNYLLYGEKRYTRIIVAALSLAPALSSVIFINYFKRFTIFGFNVLPYTDVNIELLFLTFIILLVCIVLPAAVGKIIYAVPVVAALYSLKCVTPIGQSEENVIIETAADWLYNSNTKINKIYSDHVMFTYYYGLKTDSYNAVGYDSTILGKLRENDIIVYDTHYAIRKIKPEVLDLWQSKYRILQQFGGNVGFKIFLLQGIKTP